MEILERACAGSLGIEPGSDEEQRMPSVLSLRNTNSPVPLGGRDDCINPISSGTKKHRRDDNELNEAVMGMAKRFNQMADVITTESDRNIQHIVKKEVQLALEPTQRSIEELKMLI